MSSINDSTCVPTPPQELPSKLSDEITIPATLDQLDTAFDFLHKALRASSCPSSVINSIDVAFEELFVNVCRYAYVDLGVPGDCTISYYFAPDSESVTISLEDTGIPFDPLTLKDPTKPANIQEAKIGGLGIFMVKKMMDNLAYTRKGDANVTSFRKDW